MRWRRPRRRRLPSSMAGISSRTTRAAKVGRQGRVKGACRTACGWVCWCDDTTGTPRDPGSRSGRPDRGRRRGEPAAGVAGQHQRRAGAGVGRRRGRSRRRPGRRGAGRPVRGGRVRLLPDRSLLPVRDPGPRRRRNSCLVARHRYRRHRDQSVGQATAVVVQPPRGLSDRRRARRPDGRRRLLDRGSHRHRRTHDHRRAGPGRHPLRAPERSTRSIRTGPYSTATGRCAGVGTPSMSPAKACRRWTPSSSKRGATATAAGSC